MTNLIKIGRVLSRVAPVFAVTIFVMLGAASPSLAQSSSSDIEARVDKIFAEWNHSNSPGCELAVVKDGKIIYEKGYGMSDLDHDIPMSGKSVFYLASMSKQFTAACIAILVERGKLSLDDDIRKYFPELPEYQAPIKVRNLVHHTSGIRDFLAMVSISGRNIEDVMTEKGIIEELARQRHLNFTPGDRFLYSNSGYWLLAALVKRVTGQSLHQFADENIFRPLGMTHTHFHDDRHEIIKNRAIGYDPAGKDQFKMDEYWNFDQVGDGGLMSTVEDLYLWDQNFYHNKLEKGLTDLQLTTEKLNNGEPNEYAFGLMPGTYRGLKAVTHGGALMGFRTEMIRFPEQHFSVICLANLASMNPTALVKKVADIYLEGQFTGTEAVAEKTISLPEAEINARAGYYRDPVTGDVIRLEAKGGKLAATTFGITIYIAPVASDRFVSVGAPFNIQIRFQQKPGADRPGIVIGADAQPGDYYAPITPVSVSEQEMSELAGNYYSDELQVTYKLSVSNGKLHLSIPNSLEGSLVPSIKDAFAAPGGINLMFTRDSSGKVNGFVMNDGRALGFEFVRKD